MHQRTNGAAQVGSYLAIGLVSLFLAGGVWRLAFNPFSGSHSVQEVWASSMIWTTGSFLVLGVLLVGAFVMRRTGTLGKRDHRILFAMIAITAVMLVIGQWNITRHAEAIAGHEFRFFNRYF
jgi:uncharacterized RDD family membrane protein YckC